MTGWLRLYKNASPEQLKKLADAILKWVDSEQEQGFVVTVDAHTVDDLAQGELPQPLAIQMTRGRKGEPGPKAGELTRQIQKLGPKASFRFVRFHINPHGGRERAGIAAIKFIGSCGAVESFHMDEQDRELSDDNDLC